MADNTRCKARLAKRGVGSVSIPASSAVAAPCKSTLTEIVSSHGGACECGRMTPNPNDLVDFRERHVFRASLGNATVVFHGILVSGKRGAGACISWSVRSHEGLENRHVPVTAGVGSRVAGRDCPKVHAHGISMRETEVCVQLSELLEVSPNDGP